MAYLDELAEVHGDRISVHVDDEGTGLDTGALVAEVAETYQRNLARIAMLIHSKPSSSIKEFARAFDLKKDR